MAQLDRIDNYEAAVFGFEGILVNTDLEWAIASKQAPVAVAEAISEYRPVGALAEIMEHLTLDDDTAAQQIAEALYNVVIIDDNDPEDELVRSILEQRQRLYQEHGASGFQERAQAIDFVGDVRKVLSDRVGVVTAAPSTQVESFLGRYDIANWVSVDHIFAGDTSGPHEVTAESYITAAEKLGVTTAEKLLVIDRVDENLLAAEAMGATVVSLQVGATSKQMRDLRSRDPRFEVVVDSFWKLRDELSIKSSVTATSGCSRLAQPLVQ
jgi:phosphoglycolate phosphatase-like HAD superfamily hydrolase